MTTAAVSVSRPGIDVRRLLPPTAALVAAALVGAAVASRSPVVMGAALVPFLGALLVKPDNATLLFSICFYMNLPVLAAHSGAGSLLGSAFVLLLFAPLVAHVVIGRRAIVFTAPIALMVGYLIAMVLSASIAAQSAPGTTSAIGTFLMEGLVLVLLLVNVVRTPEMLRNVIWMVLMAGATMGTISLWQELTHSYGKTLGGLAQVESLTYKVQHGADQQLRPRLAGPIGEKNRYAQIMLVLLPLAIWIVRTEQRRVLRIVGAGMGALTLAGALLTFSRGAFVALVLTVLVALAMRFLSARQVVPMAIVLVGLTFAIAPDYITRVQSLSTVDAATSTATGTADASLVGRATENLAAFNTFRDHPVLGVGPGEFFASYSQDEGNALDLRFLQTRRHAHNLYLEMAADVGVLGLGMFLAIVLLTMAQLRRLSHVWARRRPEMAELARALILALVAYLASGIFLQLSFQRYFWFLIALANATIWILSRLERTAR
jgi:O-antigen ligase